MWQVSAFFLLNYMMTTGLRLRLKTQNDRSHQWFHRTNTGQNVSEVPTDGNRVLAVCVLKHYLRFESDMIPGGELPNSALST